MGRATRQDSSNENSNTGERKGCGCGTIVLYGLLLIGLLVVGAWTWANYKVEAALTEGMSATERADFEKWFDEPLNIPSEWATFHPADSPEMKAKKTEVKSALENLSKSFASYLKTSTIVTTATLEQNAQASVAQMREGRGYRTMFDDLEEEGMPTMEQHLRVSEKLELGMPLTPEESSSFTLMMNTASDVHRELQQLVGMNGYVMNTRGMMPEEEHGSEIASLTTYAGLLTKTGETTRALQVLTDCVKYVKLDPEFDSFSPIQSNDFPAALQTCAQYTTDVVFQKQVLAMLTSWEPMLDKVPFENLEIDRNLLRLPALLSEVDSRYKTPKTRREWTQLRVNLSRVLKNIESRLPADDIRHQQLFGAVGYQADHFDDLMMESFVPSGPWMVAWYFMRKIGNKMLIYDSVRESFDNRNSIGNSRHLETVASFRLRKLAIARTIARTELGLTGNTLTDIIPAILPEVPLDPWTLQPFPFSEERQMYFSPGEDKTPGNMDDVTITPDSLAPGGFSDCGC